MIDKLQLLISIPHGSDYVPTEIFKEMLGSGESPEKLRHRIFAQGDPFTDEIFAFPLALKIVKAEYSRFVVDLNREIEEDDENGIMKLIDFDRKPLYAKNYTLSEDKKDQRLQKYYDPYHRELEKYLQQKEILGFIDGHSMSAFGPSLGPDQGKPRPAFCISNFGDANGDFVCHPLSFPAEGTRALKNKAQEIFEYFLIEENLPRQIFLNQPFDGGSILRKYSELGNPYSKPGLMVEVNRALYLNETSLLPIPGRIATLRQGLQLLAESMVEWLKNS